MADLARDTGRPAHHRAADVLGDRPSSTRHPLVAAAMVLPLAALLAVAFGGWDAVVIQASSVAGILGR
ncbi:hypothetical protein BLA24_03065 [Streptomyces cinnamoneus]|uniref:Uncharacterized protein n=1 Tax=Streptomyces cinnamoneus TaxID=53446 RepID=A0A2G1XQ78_STRCJ|nr:hypothetical protein [Streptomyces cinnamoneus]PHQ53299.1 hypothetical protein BLA24_03065 [Streptomyces cinnamoneus]PPT12396.1 hypothetical protein CYQ11_05365 [Streptomyces cinnamoneus]